MTVPDSDSFYLSIKPSLAISNFGSYGTLQLNYGYLDDFNLSLDSNTDYNYWQAAFTHSRVMDPHCDAFAQYRTLSGIQSATVGARYVINHNQEQTRYPGTQIVLAYESEDLYRYVYKEKFIQFYGFYNFLDYEKTSHVNKLVVHLNQRFGLTPLNHCGWSLLSEMYRQQLGSDYQFDQMSLNTNYAMRVSHLSSLGLETTTKISRGETPEEKNFHLYDTRDGLRAVSRYADINRNDRNLGIIRGSYSFALVSNVYDFMILTRELWLKEVYLKFFYEWGGTSGSVRQLKSMDMHRVAGAQMDINMLSLGQFPLALNLIGARAIPETNQKKEPIYFYIGFNGLF